jgi:hypothetical protein
LKVQFCCANVQGCLSFTENCVIPSAHSDFLHPFSNARPIVAPVFPQATQEFAMMGLILLADKSTETMEKIVEAGGIPILVKMLAATGGRGKLGASWSEVCNMKVVVKLSGVCRASHSSQC